YTTVLAYLSPVAEALDHLHAQEPPVVHQDVKPANLILTGRGRVLLVDLGIASSGRAATGLGTSGYVAPELAAGEEPTPAADIFSLAATAYALLTGAPPQGHRPVWEDVPEDRLKIVERSLGRALSVDPQRRPGSAGELLERLRTRLESQPAPVEQIPSEESLSSVPSIAAPPRPRKGQISPTRRTLLLAGAVVAAVIVGVLLATSPWRSERLALPPLNSVARIDARNDEIVEAVLVGIEPTRVVFGAGDLWVTNLDDKTISRVDPGSGQVVRVISSGGTPTDIAADAEGVWIANEFEGTVVSIDPRTNSIASTIALTVGSRDLALGESSVWVTNVVDETLIEIDPTSLDVVDTVRLPGKPEDVAVGMGAVWISDSSNQDLLRIDPKTHRIENIGLRAIPSAVTVGEGAVWTASIPDDSVTRVDPESGSAAAIPVGTNPAGIAAGGGAVWVANYLSGDVSRIDPDRGRVVATISVGNSPEGVAVDELDVWVTVNTR
ncbi:MAG: protein kinase domain-containing protein, partial [Actinomycetota bacterium]